MKLKYNLTIFILSAMLIFSDVILAQSKVGTSAANFLQIGLGARGVAMGEAASTNAADISGVYWNPALAVQNPGHQVYFNHVEWFADINLNFGAAVLDFGDLGSFGIMFSSLGTDQMEVTTELYQEGTGALFTASDLMLGIFYAKALTDKFNIGGTFKYINSTIWNMSADAFAVDVGLTYVTPYEPITLGMSISNFGSEMQMTGTDLAVRYDPDPTAIGNNGGVIGSAHTRLWDLPVLFRFGIAWDVVKTENHSFLLVGDILYPSSQANYLNAGVEYGFLDSYFIRAGYRQLFLEDAEGGLTLGIGVNVFDIIVDYAYSDRGLLNSVQYFSLGVKF